jgi:hypothetical protein
LKNCQQELLPNSIPNAQLIPSASHIANTVLVAGVLFGHLILVVVSVKVL